jgi:hypothetical protein
LCLPGFKSLLHMKKKIQEDDFDTQGMRKMKRCLDNSSFISTPSFPSQLQTSVTNAPSRAVESSVNDAVCNEITDLGQCIKGSDLTWGDIGAPACSRCRYAGCDRCFQQHVGAHL